MREKNLLLNKEK